MRIEERTVEMQTLAERMRYLINTLKVKQKAFAQACGVSEDYISLLVTGRRTSISEPMYRLISLIYGVNEVWLKTGEGEPFKKTEAEIRKDLQEKISAITEGMTSAQLQEVLNLIEKQMSI